MPYIETYKRDDLDPVTLPYSAGELNYSITRLVDDYLKRQGVSYSTINEVIGVLECAKLECYARVARPYEDAKKSANGDVYSCLEKCE